MSQPKVSIIIATYQSEPFLAKTLESVFAQDYAPLEVIAIDDASTDGTVALLESFARQHTNIFRYYKNEKNIGAVRNYRKLLQLASGRYVNNLNHDDYFINAHKISLQVEYLESHHDCAFIGTWSELLFPDGKHADRKTKITDLELRRSMYAGTNPFVHSTVLFRRDAALSAGGYSLKYARSNTEDLALWLTLGEKATMACIPIITTVYSVSEGAISNQRRWSQAVDVVKVLNRHHKEYRQSFGWYPFVLARIIVRQLISAIFPRILIMKLKYLHT
jgi:glycosyltransferase involved in cell wall biosynthesis